MSNTENQAATNYVNFNASVTILVMGGEGEYDYDIIPLGEAIEKAKRGETPRITLTDYTDGKDDRVHVFMGKAFGYDEGWTVEEDTDNNLFLVALGEAVKCLLA